MTDQLAPTTTAATTTGTPGTAPSRSKVIEWDDPLALAQAGATLAGREFLERIASGDLPPPPIAATFDYQVEEVGDGEVIFSAVPDESVYNPLGMVHGGYLATLLDTVAGCAAHTTLPAGTTYTTLELKVSYLRPVHADGRPIRALGRVVKPGRRAAFAEGEVRDADGRLAATASSTLLVVPIA